MDTKSTSSTSMFWSIVALVIALLSIGYCFSVVLMLVENVWDRSTRMIGFLARVIGGKMVS